MLRKLIFALCLLVMGCGPASGPAPSNPAGLKIVCTTTMITDLVQRLAQPDAQVVGLMGAGVDPHFYKASASDVAKLQQADLVFYNGLHLEGKMTEVFEGVKKTRPVVAVTDRIPKDRLLVHQGTPDPHVWFDVALWAMCVEPVATALVARDPQHAEEYTSRAKALTEELAALDAWCKTELATVPAERRIVVTSHDAFSYFGRAYGYEVVGLQGISTVTEAGISDVTKLVDFIKRKKVPAIFVESSVPRAAIDRVSQDSGAKVGGTLFSDAMGASGTPEGTYDGMVRANVKTIIEALR
jgi:manganese/zinc/iron transport system substrate-binding protein